jgi:hypothetical protein
MRFPKIFLLAFFSILSIGLTAQSYAIKGIKTFSSSGIKAILNNKAVAGYVVFYKTDKADSKNDNYRFELLDENLGKVSTVKVVLPRNAVLLQPVYNGEVLGLMFYNPIKGNYIYRSYDKALKEIGSLMTEKPFKYERAALEQMDGDAASSFYGLHPVQGKGFVRAGYGKDNDKFAIMYYDNNFKMKWSYQTPKESKDFETFLISDVNEHYVTGITMRRPNLLSHKLEYFLTIFDVETGKKILDTSVENPKEQLSISSTSLLEGTDQLVLQGEYYDLDDKAGVSKSKGFYLKIYDLKTTKVIDEKKFSWAKDINKLFNAKGKESIEDNYLNFPHTMFKAANGHYYIAFEQYKKAADAGGIAMAALGGGTSFVKIKVGNIWVMELDADYKPVAIQYYEKDGSSVSLPAGTGMMGAGLLGYFVNSIGGFDYQFLQQSEDRSTFNMAYINYDREKGEKSKTIVGNIFLAKDGTLNFDKVDITAPKRTSLYLYPAQGSNIMLSQYNSKEKTLDLKLVKLNY